jgi:hypothetical protein
MKPYQYVLLRCVPRVDREEFLNVGVVLHCEDDDFLDAACHVDERRLRAFAPDLDLGALRDGIAFVSAVSRGEPAAGDVAGRATSVRFGFLKAPRSTVVQPGPVHGGLTRDPAAELQRLLDRLVRAY